MAQNPDLQGLYIDLRARCGDDCGLLLSEEMFKGALITALARVSTGPEIETSVDRISLTIASTGAPQVELVRGPGDEVHIALRGLQTTVDLHVTKKPKDVLSTITFDVVGIDARLEIDNGTIVARRIGHRVDPVFTPGPTRDALIQSLKWDANQIATFERFENFTMFASQATIADQALRAVSGMRLREWLTGLQLGDPMTMELFEHPQSRRCVLVRSLSTNGLRRAGGTCTETVAGDIEVVRTGKFALDVDKTPRVGAPAGVEVLHASPFKRRYAYLYLPQAVVKVAFSPQVYPAVTIAGGGTFAAAQYSWSAVLAFRRIAAQIDLGDASVVLDADLLFHVGARAWIDLPCDGEQELATANLDGEVNNIRIRVRLVFDTATQRLVLDSDLENHDVTNVNARLGGIPTLAWPLNLILERVIEHNAPSLITDGLRRAVTSGRIELLDLRELIVDILALRADAYATFADNDGLIVGVGEREG